MKNRIQQYQGINKINDDRRDEVSCKKLAQDRADDDGFAIAKNAFRDQPADQDLDCWTDLWQRVKLQTSRLFK